MYMYNILYGIESQRCGGTAYPMRSDCSRQSLRRARTTPPPQPYNNNNNNDNDYNNDNINDNNDNNNIKYYYCVSHPRLCIKKLSSCSLLQPRSTVLYYYNIILLLLLSELILVPSVYSSFVHIINYVII